MPEIIFELATPEDDAELRRMLRNSPMPGMISVSFEREPNYFIGAKVEGAFHQTIIARDKSIGKIIAMGSRSIRDVYLNGTLHSVGYLSQFRISPGHRTMRKALTQGFEFVRTLHQDGRARVNFSSIIENNLPARRLLTAGLPGLPRLQEYTRLHTLAIYCRRKRQRSPMPRGLQLSKGNYTDIEAIVACLQRNGARYQLTPYWTSDTLFNPDHTPGLTPEDFFLARDGERVVGCLAVWDQSAFKQTVVRGYDGWLAHWRWLINVGAKVAGYPTFPPLNTPIHHCYASHLAVDKDNKKVFSALLSSLYNYVVGQGYCYFMLGLCENHPFFETVASTYPHIDYKSWLYLVAWEEEFEVFSQVDERVPAVDVSTL